MKLSSCSWRGVRAAMVAASLAACTVAAMAADKPSRPVQAGSVSITQAWARPTVAGQMAGGAFLTLHNAGSTPDKLLSGSTPAAERVELHIMAMEGDVMKMREVPAIELPAGTTVMLRPGQLHLMLMGLKAPLKAGDTLPLTLRFDKGGEVKVDVAVQAVAPVGARGVLMEEQQHGKHEGHDKH